MKYLVKTETLFYDGHGCPDNGNIKLEISSNKLYDTFVENEFYVEDYYETGYKLYNEDEHEYESTDGYNCKVEFITVKKITEEEVIKFENLIKDYNSLVKSF